MHDVTQSICRDFVTTRYATSATYVLVRENTPQSTIFLQASDTSVRDEAAVLHSDDKLLSFDIRQELLRSGLPALCAISNCDDQQVETLAGGRERHQHHYRHREYFKV